jgi:hypothetical protein
LIVNKHKQNLFSNEDDQDAMYHLLSTQMSSFERHVYDVYYIVANLMLVMVLQSICVMQYWIDVVSYWMLFEVIFYNNKYLYYLE